MKICCVSHSNIHPRQQHFLEELSKYAEVLAIGPIQWGKTIHEKNKLIKSSTQDYELLGFKTAVEKNKVCNMTNYLFENKAYDSIRDFDPDIIYLLDELNSPLHQKCIELSKELNCKFVTFIWENF